MIWLGCEVVDSQLCECGFGSRLCECGFAHGCVSAASAHSCVSGASAYSCVSLALAHCCVSVALAHSCVSVALAHSCVSVDGIGVGCMSACGARERKNDIQLLSKASEMPFSLPGMCFSALVKLWLAANRNRL